MKATVYYRKNGPRFEECPEPIIIEPADTLIRLTKTTICGTNLGIWKGKNPEIEKIAKEKYGSFNGRILGHEGIGIVEEVGSAAKRWKKGDKVIISCVGHCGQCENCQKQLYSHCLSEGGSWILGYTTDGTHAEYIRTPFIDNSLYLLPEEPDTDITVLLSDILPAAHEIGVQYGDMRPGQTVAVIGAGLIGLDNMLTSQLYSPARIIVVDLDDNRLQITKEISVTNVINSGITDVISEIMKITDERSVDCAIEAVGHPLTWDICQKIVREGGHIANVDVHGQSVNFEIEKLWIKNMTITTGLVSTDTTNILLKACCSGRLNAQKLATYHFKFTEIEKAYDIFKNATDYNAIKVMIEY